MKKQHVNLLIIGMLIMLTTTAFSQSIVFTYDKAGNRITRALLIEKISNDRGASSSEEQKSMLALEETITIEDVKVTISPNPNGGKFNVTINNLSQYSNVELYLHNMLGKQIYYSKQPLLVNTVDITNQQNGTYLLTVIVNGTKETWKVIKQ